MPNFSDTIADDWEMLAVDWGEPLTLRVRLTETTFTDYTITGWRRIIEEAIGDSDARLRGKNVDWVLPQASLTAAGVPATSPKDGDVVRQADGTDWGVGEVKNEGLGQFQVCINSVKYLTATG